MDKPLFDVLVKLPVVYLDNAVSNLDDGCVPLDGITNRCDFTDLDNGR